MQDKMKLNGKVVKQPDKGLGYEFETTYSEDAVRVMKGKANIDPLFTVESYSYSATNLTESEMSEILQIVALGEPYTLHHRSPYYGRWRDGQFYTGKGSLSIGSWKEDEECYESLSFNMIGVDPI